MREQQKVVAYCLQSVFPPWGSTLPYALLKMLCVVIFSLFVAFSPHSEAWGEEIDQQPLLISIHQPEGTPLFGWMSLFYKDLFSRLDIPIILIYLPPKRATAYAGKGYIDGQVGRMASYSEKVENQLKVTEPIYSIDMVAYVRTSPTARNYRGWQSLAKKGLKVDYLRGIAIAEKHLLPLIPSPDLQAVDTLQQGFLRLREGRSDLFVASNHIAEPALLLFGVEGEISQGGILQSVGFYPHLHKRHKNLVPLLERAIRDMKKEGLIDQYQQQALE